jgi:hypothetical protein
MESLLLFGLNQTNPLCKVILSLFVLYKSLLTITLILQSFFINLNDVILAIKQVA